jgi:hypothetical protein
MRSFRPNGGHGRPTYRTPQIIIPNDKKLIAQLTSRRKLYESRGREKLESKADLKARGIESPDRADALIGAIVLSLKSQIDWKEALAFQREIKHQMQLDYQRTSRGRTAYRVALRALAQSWSAWPQILTRPILASILRLHQLMAGWPGIKRRTRR